MKVNRVKIQVIVAAGHFFYRLGMKTFLNVIGVESELYEAGSFDDLISYLAKNKDMGFIIINDDILSASKEGQIKTIRHECPGGKIMIIREHDKIDIPDADSVLNVSRQSDILEKFQAFFSEKGQEEDKNHSILSDREIEVLKAVARGYSNKQIAENLYISINTVITHRKKITEKLDIKTISGLTVYAIMNNLISPEDVRN